MGPGGGRRPGGGYQGSAVLYMQGPGQKQEEWPTGSTRYQPEQGAMDRAARGSDSDPGFYQSTSSLVLE